MSLTYYELPWPVSTNHLYSVFRGRKVLSHEGRAYFNTAITLLLKQKIKLQRAFLEKKPIKAIYKIYPPDKRLRDADNLIKATQDSLVKAGIITDDRYIKRFYVIEKEIVPHGKIVVGLSYIK